MKVTALSTQVKNPDRINVFVDGKFRFGLDISQVVDLGVKVGLELDQARLAELESESQFGVLYTQALNYCLIRPRSTLEVSDYLRRKTQPKPLSTTNYQTANASPHLTERVLKRLIQKQHLSDWHFAKWWVDNRRLRRGVSQRQLIQELYQKGIDQSIIEQVLDTSERDDLSELGKLIVKKAHRYPDRAKLIRYLANQGFKYDDIKQALDHSES